MPTGDCSRLWQLLIGHGADIGLADHDGRTALHWAAKLQLTDCLRLLLPSAFKCAGTCCVVTHADACRRALVNTADNEQLTPLHWAVQCEHPRHVELLLEHQADAGAIDRLGRTALHYCVSANALECLQVLLERDSGLLNIADQQGRTALHLSCAEGTADVARFLLAVPGIDVNATDHRLTTPLHWAAVCNRPEARVSLRA